MVVDGDDVAGGEIRKVERLPANTAAHVQDGW
jgi:hypothetical protein